MTAAILLGRSTSHVDADTDAAGALIQGKGDTGMQVRSQNTVCVWGADFTANYISFERHVSRRGFVR